ncbi:TPA: hypothetical protein ACSCYS_003499 [Aeromonas veronii]
MSDKLTYVFDGMLTAISPMTVTLKGASTIAGHRLPRNGGQDAPAYWPATTIRGKIRHMTHRAVVNALKQANEGKVPLDLADHFLLAQGVDIEGDLPAPNAGEINALESLGLNPLLSLFGYWGASSKASIDSAFPPAGSTAMFGSGARGIMFERDPDLLAVLDTTQVDRLENILIQQSEASVDIQALKSDKKELTKQLKAASKEEKDALFKKMNAIDEAIAARKEEKTEAKESIRRPIDPYEAICAGTQMTHRMEVASATQIELGLFIAGLLELARSPHMGGHRNHNCGTFKAEWKVTTWPVDAFSPIELGAIAFGPEGFTLTGDVLKEAYDAWLSQRSELTFSKGK